MAKLPDFAFEDKYWNDGYSVIGIDEVGRGAFAGPATVAGISFDPKYKKKLLSLGINDSKKLSSQKREYLSLKIREIAEFSETFFIDVSIINKIGIGKAVFLGMREIAEMASSLINPYMIVDAFKIPRISIPQKEIIRGDSLSVSIAAASIVAKVERDNLMVKISEEFPKYGFSKHKGYGTNFHRSVIKKEGISPQHRIDFCRKTVAC